MKKLLLVVGLIVLFFAQSSYAERVYKKGNTLLELDDHENRSDLDWDIAKSYNIDKYPKGSALAHIYFDSPYDDCVDLFSKDYLNTNFCERINIVVEMMSSKTSQVRKDLDVLASITCPNGKVILKEKIKKHKLGFFPTKTNAHIICKDAEKRKKEAEKKLAKQEAVPIAGSVWRVTKPKKYIMRFFHDGNCEYSIDKSVPCTWKQNGEKLYWEVNYFSRSNVVLSGNTFSGKASNNDGKTWKVKATAEYIEKQTTEKPKEEEPKPSPDDNKIVAASSGTGFFVSSSGHMVTNYHVIEECNSVKAHYKGSEIDAKVLFMDKTNDLAIIKTNLKPNKVYPISDEDVSLLEDIIVAGYPLGKKISAAIKTSKGSVTALAGIGDNYSNFQIDAALNRGNSGGPIMDQKGNIVGVAVAHYGKESGVESFNFGIKSSTLKTFANSNNFKFTPASQDELSNKDLGKLITEATIYLECWMSVAKIKQFIAEEESRKAFFSDYK